MRVLPTALLIFAVPFASACGGGGGGSSLAATTTRSGFTTVTGTTANATLSSERNNNVSNAAVGTAAYVVGLDTRAGQAVAASGIAPGATTGPAITNGQATYATRYGYRVISSVTRNTAIIRGNTGTETGNMTLNADFDRGTLTGAGPELTVNGTINGTTVGGTVRANYDIGFGTTRDRGAVTGPLTGQIGNTGVIGAFHGADPTTVMAGGLVGTKN